jgi:ATP-binding protein involved in chromosome partitioning
MRTTSPVPVEIDRSGETEARFRWADGHESIFSARLLRTACPCAECVDELSGARILDPARVPEEIRILSASLVGRYAVSFRFDDGHSLGIYTFDSLRRACPCRECRAGA